MEPPRQIAEKSGFPPSPRLHGLEEQLGHDHPSTPAPSAVGGGTPRPAKVDPKKLPQINLLF